jgi:putative ABC transport system permease protein
MNLSANTLNERRKEMGVLRALGCSKIRLASLVYGEFTLMALIGSFSGGISAWILAPLLGGKLNAIVGAQYGMSIALKPSDFDIRYALIIALVGSLVVVLGITKSVWRILQVSPVEAINPLTVEDEKIKNVDFKSLIYFTVSISPLFFMSSYPVIYLFPLIGTLLFGPSIIVLFLRSLGKIPSLQQSKVGRLAWEYAKADPKSVGKKTRGIMIGLMAVFMIAMVQTSFEEALMGRFVHTSRPDMFVTANGNLTSPLQLQPLEEGLALEIEKIPGVLGAYGERVVKILYKGQSLTLRAIDEVPPDSVRLKSPYSYFDIVDRSTAEAGHDLYHGTLDEKNSINIFASETLATNLGVKTGETLDFASPTGNLKAKIVGVVRDLSAGNGVVYIARDPYKKWWNDPLLSGFGLAIDEKADPNLIKSQIEDAFSEKYGVVVTLDKKLKTDIMKVVGRAFYFMAWIEGLIVFVALLNFMTTFLFDIKARTKQFATLRSMGMPKTDLMKMVVLETLFLTVTSTALAYLMALPFSWRMIGTGVTSSLGWYIGFHFDGVEALTLISMSVFIISLAGIIPALKASSIEIASSLRSE